MSQPGEAYDGMFQEHAGLGLPEVDPELIVGFDQYRQYCDEQNDSFRKLGVLDEESYNAAARDERTVFAAIDGRRVPALIPAEYEGGYDTERCREMTERRETMLLSLPLASLAHGSFDRNNLVGGSALPPDFAVMVEQPTDERLGDLADHDVVAGLLRGVGGLTPQAFHHEWLKDTAGHETAWMSLYGFSFGPAEAAGGEDRPDTLEEAWQQYRVERDLPERPEDSTGKVTYVFSGERMRESPQVSEALWTMSEIGFGKTLGAYHPVSMDETKAFFEGHLLDEDTYTAVCYENGQPVCFGSIMTDIKKCEWLNTSSTSLESDLAELPDQDEQALFFSEIISNGEKGAGHSPQVMKTLFDVVSRVGQDRRVYFESTNLSALYIPKIASQIMEKQADRGVIHVKRPIEQLDKLDYWYAVSDPTA